MALQWMAEVINRANKEMQVIRSSVDYEQAPSS
jgi:hypothetical protein